MIVTENVTVERPKHRRILWASALAVLAAVGIVLAIALGNDDDPVTPAAARTSTTTSSSTSATAAPVEQPEPVSNERLVDACKAQGQYYTLPSRLFSVLVSDASNRVEVVWESADLTPGEFATQFVVTGTGTGTQHGTTKAFSYRCLVSAGAAADVISFDVTPR